MEKPVKDYVAYIKRMRLRYKTLDATMKKFVKRLKFHKKYLSPIVNPNKYTKPKKRYKFGPYKDIRCKYIRLNDLNFQNEEVLRELYKFDRKREVYKKFRYPEGGTRKIYFSRKIKDKKDIYINEALKIMPELLMDMKVKFYNEPLMYVKKYINNKFTEKEIKQINLKQILIATYFNNLNSGKQLAADFDDLTTLQEETRKIRLNDRILYFFKVENKLIDRKKTLIFEQRKRDILKKKIDKISFKYVIINKLTMHEARQMIKMLPLYDRKTKTIPFLDEPHPIFKNAKTNFEIGKAIIAYYRRKEKKKKDLKFFKKMKWTLKQRKFFKKIKKINFSLVDFFSADYSLKKILKLKKKKSINFYLKSINKNELYLLFKSFDRVFLPIIIGKKFNKKK